MAKEIKKTTGITAVANGLERMLQNMKQPAQVTGIEHMLQGNAANFDFKTFIAKENIIMSLRLWFILYKPYNKKE